MGRQPCWCKVSASETALSLGDGPAFHLTSDEVRGARLIEVADTPVRLVIWEQVSGAGATQPYYAVSLDGQTMAAVRPTSYTLKLRQGNFDPVSGRLSVADDLAAGPDTQLYIVQFQVQPLQVFRDAIERRGGTVYKFLANHAHLVKMTPAVRDQVEALPYVRWVGAYHPAYRIEEFLRDNHHAADEFYPHQRYNIQVFEAGKDQKQTVAARIEALGGKVNQPDAGKFLLEATLTPAQLFQVIRWDEVAFVDRWSPYSEDMDNAREYGGANHLETVAGYTGQGVRGEVFDGGFNLGHVDFASRPLITHGSVGVDSHGAACSGICFGDGTGSAQARGLLPDGQGIVADYNTVGLYGTNRYNHTAELLGPPYYAVFQTSSVGSDRTTSYTTISASHDTMLFDLDIAHTQSQSNAGDQMSRPQAWAKNVISGGGAYHENTLSPLDDNWNYGASIGPASDGRIKPDLCAYYDDIYTTYVSSGNGYDQFGGTSGATPIIGGHVGLFFQMWANGIFGNEVDPGGTVFENRCHMTTAKAVLINTAQQYPFSGTTHDLTRVHQGWGWPDLGYLYDMRDKIAIIDESEILANLETREFLALVESGEPALRATMTYADPAGLPSSSQHRINDLTLKVTSPTGTVYWGNNGLLTSNWSTPGGSPNVIDTVENVFVQNPQAGIWTVEVSASEINEDGHVETPEMDADFALVVSGAFMANCTSAGRVTLDKPKYACNDVASVRVVDCDLNTDDEVIETTTVLVTSESEPAGETLVLTESGAATADFRGSIFLSTSSAPSILQVGEGDTVTVTYIDADDGEGGVNVEVAAAAQVDCTPPVIGAVDVVDLAARSATIEFDTDENANSAVHYGLSCAALLETVDEIGFATEHSIPLYGLDDAETYYFVIEVEDEAGNAMTYDHGGSCYNFTTPDVPNFFTEQFGSNNDLDNLTLFFEPDGGPDYYDGCVEPNTGLPTDPAGGTTLSLSDDGNANISLTGGATVSLYGVSYGSFFVNANGSITFSSADGTYEESTAQHFSQPRISALFDDLNPYTGGSVKWQQLGDRVAVTWQDVPEYYSDGANTFQIEMFFAGPIHISYRSLSALDGVVGLSAGGGQDPDFYETDLSDLGTCGAPPLQIVSSDPADGEIDARRPHEADGSGAYGWEGLALVFDGDVAELTSADFEVTEVGGDGLAPQVMAVTQTDVDSVWLDLSGPLEPVTWTTVTHLDSGGSVTLGYLPADADGSGIANANDITEAVDLLNYFSGGGSVDLWHADIDRSGIPTANDIVELVDLLNGAGAYDAYFGVELP